MTVYCTNCGKELNNGDKFCIKCGTPVGVSPIIQTPDYIEETVLIEQPIEEILPEPQVPTAAESTEKLQKGNARKERKKISVFAIIGFVLSLVCVFLNANAPLVVAVAGLVFSIVAMVRIKKKGQWGAGFATAGIILGAISTAISLVVTLMMLIFSVAIPGIMQALVDTFMPNVLSMLGDLAADVIWKPVEEYTNNVVENAVTALLQTVLDWFASLF